MPTAPDGTAEVVFYDAGVGTEGRLLTRLRGGVFGEGLKKNIGDAYRFLAHNYDEATRSIRRGEYMARSTVGLVRNAGILHKLHADCFDDALALYQRRDAPRDSYDAQRFKECYSRRSRASSSWASGTPSAHSAYRRAIGC